MLTYIRVFEALPWKTAIACIMSTRNLLSAYIMNDELNYGQI